MRYCLVLLFSALLVSSPAFAHKNAKPTPRGTAKAQQELSCSFCSKSSKEVRQLIAGPSVTICDECVGLCNDILEEMSLDDPEDQGSRPLQIQEDDRERGEAQILDTHQKYVTAVRASDWAEAATYFDPPALAGIRETMKAVLEMDSGEGVSVAETMVGMSPDALAKLDDSGFFGAFMTGIIAMNPGLGDAMANAQMNERGVAFGADGEAFVVYEMVLNSEGVDMTKFAVTPMVRGANGIWALQMTGEFKGIADMIGRMGDRAEQAQDGNPPPPEASETKTTASPSADGEKIE